MQFNVSMIFSKNKIIITVFLLLISYLFSNCSSSDQIMVNGKQVELTFQKEVVQSYDINYLLYLPEGYNATSKKFPLVFFLHGVGERGKDYNLIEKHGPPKLVEESKQFPFILVSPQCPDKTSWDTNMLKSLLDEIELKYNVDKNRIYLTGLSMGGIAVWKLAIENPEMFAAIVPVSARGYSQDVCVLKNVPVWAFHGANDDVIPLEDGEKMINALKECGGNVRFTVYPESGHDAWTETYNKPELYDWMLNFSLDTKKAK